jgi:hypothetical protein
MTIENENTKDEQRVKREPEFYSKERLKEMSIDDFFNLPPDSRIELTPDLYMRILKERLGKVPVKKVLPPGEVIVWFKR